MSLRPASLTLQQAAEQSTTLAGLVARAQDSEYRLRTIMELIPPELRAAVRAGPAGDKDWCLLVNGSAAAAKLRQLQPTLQARLKSAGWEIATIRIKVLAATSHSL